MTSFLNNFLDVRLYFFVLLFIYFITTYEKIAIIFPTMQINTEFLIFYEICNKNSDIAKEITKSHYVCIKTP